MKNKSLNIIIFEPDPFYLINVDLILAGLGQQIAGKATHFKEGEMLIRKVETGQVKADVAIMSDFMGRSWQEGEQLAAKLRAVQPSIKIIGYSVVREEKKPEWVDSYAVKSGLDNQQTILKELAKLLNIEVTVQKEEDDY